MAQGLETMRFIPDALPDLNLSEIDTKISLNAGGHAVRVFPIAVEADSEAAAVKMGADHSLFLVKNRDYLVAVLDGKAHRITEIDDYKEVADGLELAKAIRMGADVGVITAGAADKVKQVEEQLRVAMFLTNSKDIDALRKAPMVTL